MRVLVTESPGRQAHMLLASAKATQNISEDKEQPEDKKASLQQTRAGRTHQSASAPRSLQSLSVRYWILWSSLRSLHGTKEYHSENLVRKLQEHAALFSPGHYQEPTQLELNTRAPLGIGISISQNTPKIFLRAHPAFTAVLSTG